MLLVLTHHALWRNAYVCDDDSRTVFKCGYEGPQDLYGIRVAPVVKDGLEEVHICAFDRLLGPKVMHFEADLIFDICRQLFPPLYNCLKRVLDDELPLRVLARNLNGHMTNGAADVDENGRGSVRNVVEYFGRLEARAGVEKRHGVGELRNACWVFLPEFERVVVDVVRECESLVMS
jgi:hypothetical protein